MKCPNCPVDGDVECDGEKVGRFCELIDPKNKNHDGSYVDLLRRRSRKQDGPGLAVRAVNLSKALYRHAASGLKGTSPEVMKGRLTICNACDFKIGDRCSSCGCPIDKKIRWRSEVCPKGFWEKES